MVLNQNITDQITWNVGIFGTFWFQFDLQASPQNSSIPTNSNYFNTALMKEALFASEVVTPHSYSFNRSDIVCREQEI